jgi:nucleoside-diphosphate-sugar epimerase
LQQEKKLLITGGAGYIGSQLVKNALQSNLLINVLDSVEPDYLNFDFLKHLNINYYAGSLTDETILKRCTENVDYIIHLAGISDGRAGKSNPELTKQINIDTLKKLLVISKGAGVKKFVFASTMGVYGNAYKIPLTEDLPLNPIDPYSESKAIGEQLVQNANTASFATICMRIAMVYGVSDKMKFDFIVNRLTIDALQKKVITIIGGDQKRPQIHIDDLCDLFIESLKMDMKLFDNQCYNVVGQNPSINDIIFDILSQLPKTKIKKLPARKNEDSFEMSGNKLSNLTGYNFKRTIKIGVQEIIKNFPT